MEKKVQNKSEEHDLSRSYTEGIERILGSEKNFAFNFDVPVKVLEQREKYWETFFDKYSKEFSAEIDLNDYSLKLCTNTDEDNSSEQRMPMRKPRSLVQYWVDTGDAPCKAFTEDKEHSESGSSLSERDVLGLLGCSTKKKVINGYGKKEKLVAESSCSSVDTAAYILSNTNVTKKADTIAIVEGAKESDTSDSENIFSVKAVKCLAGSSTSTTVNEHSTVDNNCNEYPNRIKETSLCSTMGNMLQRANSQARENVTKVYQTLGVNTSSGENVLNKTTNESNSLSHRLIVSHNDTVEKISEHVINDNMNIVADMECEISVSTSTSNERGIFTTTKSIMACDSTTKLINHKKLYTGRDSPVDLLEMKSTSGNRISKSRQSLHPAFDSKWKLSKRPKTIWKRKRRNYFQNRSFERDNTLANASYSSEDEGTEDILGQTDTSPNILSQKSRDMMMKLQQHMSLMKSSVNSSLEEKKENLLQTVSNEELNVSAPINEAETQIKTSEQTDTNKDETKDKDETKNETKDKDETKNETKDKDETNNETKDKDETNNETKDKDEINNETKDKDETNNETKDKDETIHETENTVLHSGNLKPVIRLTRIPENEINKYKKAKNVVMNLSNAKPIVYLQRLSQNDIQRYKPLAINQKPQNILPSDDYPQTFVESTDTYTCKSFKKSNMNKRENDSMQKLAPSREIDDVNSVKTSSSQSTILICSCGVKKSHDFCSMSENEQDENFSITRSENDDSSTTRKGRRKRNVTETLNNNDEFKRLKTRTNSTLVASRKSGREASNLSLEKSINASLTRSNKVQVSNEIKYRKPVVILRRLSSGTLHKYSIHFEKNNHYSTLNNSLKRTDSARVSLEGNENYLGAAKIPHKNAFNELLNSHSRHSVTDTESVVSLRLELKSPSPVQHSTSEKSELTLTRSLLKDTQAHAKGTGKHAPNIFLSSDEDDGFLKLVQDTHPKKKMKLNSNDDTSYEDSDSILSAKRTNKTLKSDNEMYLNNVTKNSRQYSDRKHVPVSETPKNNKLLSLVLQSSSEDEISLTVPRSTRAKARKESLSHDKSDENVSANCKPNEYITRNKSKHLDALSTISEDKNESPLFTVSTRSRSPETSDFNQSLRRSPRKIITHVKAGPNKNINDKKVKTRAHRLRFQTRLVDSDTESDSFRSTSFTSDRD